MTVTICGATACGAIVATFGEFTRGRLHGGVTELDWHHDDDATFVDGVHESELGFTSDLESALSSTETLSLSGVHLELSLSTLDYPVLLSYEEAASDRGDTGAFCTYSPSGRWVHRSYGPAVWH